MIIEKIKIENIRSYKEQEIILPKGAVLLSGDVGSGKSTILLAVDFALFGLQKGILTGETLLRKGEKKGSVEITLKLGNKEVIIKRNLTRGTSVTQESAILSINGESQRITPVELKQKILELLNYPQEMLNKKSLIYRYTVYTPQEEMKLILLGEEEKRLDTLRKIFGVDKYKRIRENSKIYTSHLRSQGKEYEGMLLDFESKRKLLESYEKEIKELETQKKITIPERESIQLQETDLNQSINLLERQLQQYSIAQQELAQLTAQLEEKINQRKGLVLQLEQLQELITTPPPEIMPFDHEKLGLLEQEHQLLKEDIKLNEQRITKHEITLQQSEKLLGQIRSLDLCPTCQQQVGEEHKQGIRNKEETIIINSKQEKESLTNLLIQLQEKCSSHELKIEQLRQAKNSQELTKLKHSQYMERIQRKEVLETTIIGLKKDVGMINIKKLALEKQLQGLTDSEELLKQKKLRLKEISEKLRLVDLDLMRVNTKINDLENHKGKLEEELIEKTKAQEKLETVKKTHYWIDNSFVPSLEKMEQQVLLKIHSDFNNLYKDWFTKIMGSEELATTLDESFTPIIEQTGYKVEYLNLSGGEKTAVALAYRLALNQVINNLVVDIKTNELIILDEPTDGFSNEQVERIQQVLEDLKIKQIIIVSHEPKIEGFVDNILRINKNDGVSSVL